MRNKRTWSGWLAALLLIQAVVRERDRERGRERDWVELNIAWLPAGDKNPGETGGEVLKSPWKSITERVVFPATCCMSNSNPCKNNLHLLTLILLRKTRGLRSVSTTVVWHIYNQNDSKPERPGFSLHESPRLVILKEDSRAPTPLASTANLKGLLQSGAAGTGALANLSMYQKAKTKQKFCPNKRDLRAKQLSQEGSNSSKVLIKTPTVTCQAKKKMLRSCREISDTKFHNVVHQ